MTGSDRKKLCFVLPEYQRSTHFEYKYEFANAASKELDFFLIVEKGGRLKKTSDSLRVYSQKFGFFPFRLVENFLALLYLRARGYRDFYVHYSFLSAFNASIVVWLLGGRVFYWNAGLPWLYRRNPVRNFFERRVYQIISFLVTGTEGLKSGYANAYRIPLSKIKVMPNWIDTKETEEISGHTNGLREKLHIASGTRILLFVHKLSRRKGAYFLADILKAVPEAVLIVIGDSPERIAVEKQCKELGVLERARFLGCLPQKEALRYFGIADVFIMPSEEEGFSHSLLEAMATGTPFVAFDAGGTKEIIPPELQRFIFRVGDIEGMVRGINELLVSKKTADMVRGIERAWVPRFGKERVLKIFFGLFA